jgi:hypothetical protein
VMYLALLTPGLALPGLLLLHRLERWALEHSDRARVTTPTAPPTPHNRPQASQVHRPRGAARGSQGVGTNTGRPQPGHIRGVLLGATNPPVLGVHDHLREGLAPRDRPRRESASG